MFARLLILRLILEQTDQKATCRFFLPNRQLRTRDMPALAKCDSTGGMTGFQKMTPIQNVAVGVAAGQIEITLLQPILYWKNAQQQSVSLFTPAPSSVGSVRSPTPMTQGAPIHTRP